MLGFKKGLEIIKSLFAQQAKTTSIAGILFESTSAHINKIIGFIDIGPNCMIENQLPKPGGPIGIKPFRPNPGS